MTFTKFIGCMIGAAYGDALGAPVEFMSLGQIRSQYGPRGITALQPERGTSISLITDDTQMAIATARGLLANPRGAKTGNEEITARIWQAYLEWLKSQSDPNQCRAPGTTCLSALRGGTPGSIRKPLNWSAGCGGIMRVHPIGMALPSDPKRAFVIGMEAAALTHGHPNGYVPAGVFAMIIAGLCAGKNISSTIADVRNVLTKIRSEDTVGTIEAVRVALRAPTEGDHGAIIDSSVGQTGIHGGGWLGHDCLAIALYAVRCAPQDPIEAVRIAVNHSGDTDSTGSVAGAIVGALHGPTAFLDVLSTAKLTLEHQPLLESLARELSSFDRSSV